MASKKKRGRPATGKTPHRFFRMPDEDWQKVKDAADLEGVTASDFVRDVLLRAADRVLKKHEKETEG